MGNREMRHKCILYVIIFVLTLSIGLVTYFRFIGPSDDGDSN